MRITGGQFRGRNLLSPSTDLIRPTSDKTRQALFNALLSRYDISDAVVIDACAGTGALGLEALSHGASRAIFLDSDSTHLALAKKNACSLSCDDKCRFIKADLLKLSVRPQILSCANLCLIDPPYRKGILLPALQGLRHKQWIDDDTIVIAESEADYSLPFPLVFERVYGDTRIMILTGGDII